MERLRNTGEIVIGECTDAKGNLTTSSTYNKIEIDGKSYNGVFNLSSKNTNMRIGTKISIKYLPENPDINKPMYQLYRWNNSIREKYKHEFVRD